MLKHGRAGVPMEVMGLMLGEFVDEYTVRVVDVFAMPQSGTVCALGGLVQGLWILLTRWLLTRWEPSQGVSVEAVDPVFQAKMLDMLRQTGRPEMVVGWYHSHPGFGCWLSGVDVNTQQVRLTLPFSPHGDAYRCLSPLSFIQSFEALNPRAVAVVVDPIQSVKGKVVIDAFRCINPQMVMMGQVAMGLVHSSCLTRMHSVFCRLET